MQKQLTICAYNKAKKSLRKYRDNFFRNYASFYIKGGHNCGNDSTSAKGLYYKNSPEYMTLVGSSSPCHRRHRPDETEENEDEVYEDDNRDGCGAGSVEET